MVELRHILSQFPLVWIDLEGLHTCFGLLPAANSQVYFKKKAVDYPVPAERSPASLPMGPDCQGIACLYLSYHSSCSLDLKQKK